MQNKSLEVRRAVFHCGTMMLALGVGIWCPRNIALAFGFIFLFIIVVLETIRLKYKPAKEYAQTRFEGMLRKDETHRATTMVYAMVGMIIVYYVFPLPVFVMSMLVSACADPIARIMGRKFGFTKLPWTQGKTVVGSMAFFATTVTIVFWSSIIILPTISIGHAICTAALVTVAEAYSKRIMIDDNLSVPVATAIALQCIYI